jgi:UDP-N-acetylglucosamine acyltransferase
MAGANIGMNAAIHQKQVIGSYAMVGMGAVVTKLANVEPGSVFAGNPARYLNKNVIGLNRANITLPQLEEETRRFEALRHD